MSTVIPCESEMSRWFLARKGLLWAGPQIAGGCTVTLPCPQAGSGRMQWELLGQSFSAGCLEKQGERKPPLLRGKEGLMSGEGTKPE